jgi:hypothetical protein
VMGHYIRKLGNGDAVVKEYVLATILLLINCRDSILKAKGLILVLRAIFEFSMSKFRLTQLFPDMEDIEELDLLYDDVVLSNETIPERNDFVDQLLDPIMLNDVVSHQLPASIDHRRDAAFELGNLWNMSGEIVPSLLRLECIAFIFFGNELVWNSLVDHSDMCKDQMLAQRALEDAIRAWLNWVYRTQQRNSQVKRWLAIIDVSLLDWIQASSHAALDPPGASYQPQFASQIVDYFREARSINSKILKDVQKSFQTE